MKKNPGYIIETRDGKIGRTYHNKQFINGKCPVYIETSPGIYSNTGTLCDPKTLRQIGFID